MNKAISLQVDQKGKSVMNSVDRTMKCLSRKNPQKFHKQFTQCGNDMNLFAEMKITTIKTFKDPFYNKDLPSFYYTL